MVLAWNIDVSSKALKPEGDTLEGMMVWVLWVVMFG
jgi:hypothetical protein